MALNATEQSYYDHAKRSLPRFLFANPNAAQEMMGAFAVLAGALHDQIAEWLSFSFVQTATGVWLDQHARDRGTTRREDETDETLRARLATLEDAITQPVLLSHINDILVGSGYPATAAMVELRRDKAYMSTDGVDESMAFLSRGYRMAGPGRPYRIIVILPYDTDEATAAAVDEYLRKAKAAGFAHTVERRLSPP